MFASIVLGAVLQVAAVAPATRAAVAAAVRRAGLADGCSASETRSAVDGATADPVGTIGGDRVVLVSLQSQCMCGNVNCPYLVLRLGSAGATTLLVTSAYAVKAVPAPGEPLPRLHEEAHDNALVTVDSVDAYRDGRYQSVAVYRRRNDTGARKPDIVPVQFAPGASSARLSGTVVTTWYDSYAFSAVKGQTLTVGSVSSKAKLLITLELPPGTTASVPVDPGVAVKLPASGTYHLVVDTDGEGDQRYALTLAVR